MIIKNHMNREFSRTLVKKVQSQNGESLGETLVATLVAALAMVLFVTMLTTSTKLITKSEDTMTKYYEEMSNEALTGDNTNQYTYYNTNNGGKRTVILGEKAD